MIDSWTAWIVAGVSAAIAVTAMLRGIETSMRRSSDLRMLDAARETNRRLNRRAQEAERALRAKEGVDKDTLRQLEWYRLKRREAEEFFYLRCTEWYAKTGQFTTGTDKYYFMSLLLERAQVAEHEAMQLKLDADYHESAARELASSLAACEEKRAKEAERGRALDAALGALMAENATLEQLLVWTATGFKNPWLLDPVGLRSIDAHQRITAASKAAYARCRGPLEEDDAA